MKKAYLKLLKMLGKLIFRGKWEGNKTMAKGWIEILLSLWLVIDGTLFPRLCEIFPSMCSIQEATFYGSIIGFMGIMGQVLRSITTKEIKE